MAATISAALSGAGCASLGRTTETRAGQHPQAFETKITKTVQMKYLLYLPKQYETAKDTWPLMLFLHGAGERGDDLQKVAQHGPPKLVASGAKEFPFVIVSPQCPENNSWSGELEIAALNALLNDIVSRYRIDTDRVYVTGLSMGGFGTWRLALEYPDRFAAIAPICGKGDPAKADRIKHLPAWVFHGAKDPLVPLSGSQDMVDALKKCGGDVRLTVYPEAGHDSWTETYNNPELYEWFLKHTRRQK